MHERRLQSQDSAIHDQPFVVFHVQSRVFTFAKLFEAGGTCAKQHDGIMRKPSESKGAAHETESLANQVAGCRIGSTDHLGDFVPEGRRHDFIRIDEQSPIGDNAGILQRPLAQVFF